ncbi:hypothetical protein CsSME_00043378 [Camellia sinensis var. sinensis]
MVICIEMMWTCYDLSCWDKDGRSEGGVGVIGMAVRQVQYGILLSYSISKSYSIPEPTGQHQIANGL